jgi:ribosome-associated protein
MARIAIGRGLSIGEAELGFSFVRASGPGGQNVNKVATAVRLRFDLRRSPSLPWAVKQRAAHAAGQRLTLDGEILIAADRFRTQAANRADAVERLVALLAEAAIPPAERRATRPTRGSQQRRIEAKKQRSGVKAGRSRPADD